MTGRFIDDDMFGVCRRLRSIDDGYRIFRNYKTGKFEVHNVNDTITLCLVLPYETLDERTVNHVLRTRVERAQALIEEAERHNAALEKAMRDKALNRVSI